MIPRVVLDLLVAFIGQIGRTHDEAVGFTDLVVRYEPLKVPGRIPLSASRGRLSQPDAVAFAEHQHIGHPVTHSEIPRLDVRVWGSVVHQSQGTPLSSHDGQLACLLHSAHIVRCRRTTKLFALSLAFQVRGFHS